MRHFQRVTSEGYIIWPIRNYLGRKVAASFSYIDFRETSSYLIIFNLIKHFTKKMAENLICGKVFTNLKRHFDGYLGSLVPT